MVEYSEDMLEWMEKDSWKSRESTIPGNRSGQADGRMTLEGPWTSGSSRDSRTVLQ